LLQRARALCNRNPGETRGSGGGVVTRMAMPACGHRGGRPTAKRRSMVSTDSSDPSIRTQTPSPGTQARHQPTFLMRKRSSRGSNRDSATRKRYGPQRRPSTISRVVGTGAGFRGTVLWLFNHHASLFEISVEYVSDVCRSLTTSTVSANHHEAVMWLAYRLACLVGWHNWWDAGEGESVCLECGRYRPFTKFLSNTSSIRFDNSGKSAPRTQKVTWVADRRAAASAGRSRSASGG
jgi:hypothetical protein